MATFHFNLTAGRPADDQKQTTNKRPQKDLLMKVK